MLNVNIEVWGIVAMVIMLVEMSMYLAYFKDVVFACVTIVNYAGMYIYVTHLPKDQSFQEYVRYCIIALISISSFFIMMTVVQDFDKAFYRKYRKYFNSYKKMN